MMFLDAMLLIREEMERARAKHPVWPDDQVYAAAIVAEEAGELLQAALNNALQADRGPHGTSAMVAEATQTAVTAIRFLVNLDDKNW